MTAPNKQSIADVLVKIKTVENLIGSTGIDCSVTGNTKRYGTKQRAAASRARKKWWWWTMAN